jgi:predicted aspartyl protease
VRLVFDGRQSYLDDVIIDTGSAASVFAADVVAELGILPEPTDKIHRVRGVGGFEFVYSKRIDSLSIGTLVVSDFEIQVGAMHYGFPLQGLIGMDFLTAAKAIIDLGRLEIRPSDEKLPKEIP